MKKILTVLLLLSLLLYGCREKTNVIIIPRQSSEMVSLNIISPQNGEIVNSSSIKIAFELKNSDIKKDASIHFVIDNGPRMIHKSTEPFFISSLSEGRHVVRAFASKMLGESIKDPKAFSMVQFYVKNNNTNLLNTNLPMLTYNEPVGFFKKDDSNRILLDFLVHNVLLSKNGYKVIYTIDGVSRTFTSASPIYITNLSAGNHIISLELVDKAGNLAEGNFVKTQREIVVLEDKNN